MAEKGVSFFSKQTGIREFCSVAELQGKTFADIGERLYDQLLRENKTFPALIRNREALEQGDRRAGLVKFLYMEAGQERPISKSEQVLRFYINTGVNEVLFFVDVIGGMVGDHSPQTIEAFSHFQFLAHCKAVMADPRSHGTWTLMEFEPNRFRLVKTLRDAGHRLITVMLQPTAGYPRRPPQVVTIPRLVDICFAQNGQLNWTVVRGTGKFTWELYEHHANPLVYLLDELKEKYKLIF